MQLKDIKPIHKNKTSKRLGRGHASGKGKTSGRGHKGAKQRAGRLWYIGFEGGNVPFLRKIPKRGFYHKKKINFQIVNLGDIDKKFSENQEVSPKTLYEKNLIKDKNGYVKVLARGDLSRPLSFSAHQFSRGAKEKIAASGSRIQEIPLKK